MALLLALIESCQKWSCGFPVCNLWSFHFRTFSFFSCVCSTYYPLAQYAKSGCADLVTPLARTWTSRNHRLIVTRHLTLSFPSCPVSRFPWNYIQLIYHSFSGLSSRTRMRSAEERMALSSQPLMETERCQMACRFRIETKLTLFVSFSYGCLSLFGRIPSQENK